MATDLETSGRLDLEIVGVVPDGTPSDVAGQEGCAGAGRSAECNTGRPCQRWPIVVILTGWDVIEVLDSDAARRSLAAGGLRCPCGGRLRAWGHARSRRIQHADGRRERVRPHRARCRSCGQTHVLLPAGLLPARGYGLDVIGVALLGAARGQGHRTLAAQLRIPAATVRGWLRRARGNAEPLRQFAVRTVAAIDPELLPTRLLANRWAEALQTLVAAAVAVARRFGANERDLWPMICVITRGRLLAATPPT